MTWADILPLSKIIRPQKVTPEPYYGEPVFEEEHHLALDVYLDLVGPSELGSAVISNSRGE
jgi:hypothetical protein